MRSKLKAITNSISKKRGSSNTYQSNSAQKKLSASLSRKSMHRRKHSSISRLSRTSHDQPWTPDKKLNKTMRIYSARRRSMSARKEKRKEVLIHKQYDLTLPTQKQSSKKIAYENKQRRKHVFEAVSSHPKEMTVKTRMIEIGPGQREKFGLRFVPQESACEKSYVLFIRKNGRDHENILLKVKFE